MSWIYLSRMRFVVLFFFCLVGLIELPAQSRHAALIGVGAYPEDSGWEALSSANDLDLLAATLVDLGFGEENIRMLRDTQATKQGIQIFLGQDLFQRVKPGDLVYIHFSGHGQQAQDTNGDESDQLDECWVPYDSPLHYEAGVYEGERLYRDDELDLVLDALRQRLGPQGHLFLTVDACHSGTSTRGLGTARGTDVVMADQHWLTSRNRRQAPQESGNAQWTIDQLSGGSPLVAFFSSSPQQLSRELLWPEGVKYGAFTYSLCKTLQTTDVVVDYQELFQALQRRLQSLALGQTPEGEGSLEEMLFAGQLTPPGAFFRTSGRTGDTLTLTGGSLHNVHPGCQFALYPAATTDTASIASLARGTIVSSSALRSRLLLTAITAPDSLLRDAWAIQTSTVPPPIDLRLRVEISSAPLRSRVDTFLAQWPMLDRDSEGGRLILQEQSRDTVALLTFDDQELWRDRWTESSARAFLKVLENYLQASTVRLLSYTDDSLHGEVTFLVRGDSGWRPMASDTLRKGDKVRLQVRNTGSIGMYFAILDIQPDHQVNDIIPDSRTLATEYFIEPGGTWKSSSFVVGEPFGLETLKLICTEQALQLGAVYNTRGETNTISHPIEALCAASFPLRKQETRGASQALPKGRGSVHSLDFIIAPSPSE